MNEIINCPGCGEDKERDRDDIDLCAGCYDAAVADEEAQEAAYWHHVDQQIKERKEGSW
jgi:hypothetical protein